MGVRSASLQAADLDTSDVNGERNRDAVGFQGEAIGARGGGGDTRGSQLPPGKGFQRLVDFAGPGGQRLVGRDEGTVD